MIKLSDLLKENLRSGDVSKLQKGLERVLGTSINSDINSAGAHEFYINNAKFMIGIGDGIDRGTKFSFNIYDDGARKTLASGTSDNVNDIIKQTLVAAKKHKNSLLQTESVNEGRKSKDWWGVRLVIAIHNNVRAIEQLVMDDKRDPKEIMSAFANPLLKSVKGTSKHNYKPNAKPAYTLKRDLQHYGDLTNQQRLDIFKSEIKKFEKIVEALIKKPTKVGVKKLDDAWRTIWNHKYGADIGLNGSGSGNTIIEVSSHTTKKSVNEEESFTATSKKTGQTSVFKSKDARDAAVKAGTHSKIDDKEDDKSKGEKKPNMFSKDAGYDAPDADKSEPKKGNLPLDDSGDGFTGKAASHIEDELSKSIGIDGNADINDNGTIEFAFGDSDRETSLFIGREGGTYNVSVENPYGDDFGGIETFDNEADAIAHSKKLAKKYSKELGAKSEKKTSEPKTNTPKVTPRKANKALVKTVDKFSKRIGLNPDKLGKEDYEKKMLTLVHDALEDANFHSANRQIFADLYGKPELAKRPDYSNAPGFDSPEREEWEEKNSIYGKRFKSTTADFDDSDEMVGAITSQASWDGQDTIDAILDKMRKDGSNDLADKIQSSFDKDMAKNEGTIKLTDLI